MAQRVVFSDASPLIGLSLVGVIMAARRRGLIASAKHVFETLLKHDFRLAGALIDAALTSLGEQ